MRKAKLFTLAYTSLRIFAVSSEFQAVQKIQNPSDPDQPAHLHTPNSVPFPMSFPKVIGSFLREVTLLPLFLPLFNEG